MCVRPSNPKRRRAGTTAGLIGTLALIGGLITTAIVLAPRGLFARADENGVVLARELKHRQITDLIGAIIARSREVLAIHPRGASPFIEIILWLEDHDDHGHINVDEIAVVSHSDVLRTITMHTLMLPEPDPLDPPVETGPPRLNLEELRDPAFGTSWRQRPEVRRRVLATCITGMTVIPVRDVPGDHPMLRISLTWAGDSADASDEASVAVDMPARTDLRP